MIRLTRSMVDDGRLTFVGEDQSLRLVSEASTLGFEVGELPRVIPAEVGVGNGQDFKLVRVDEQGMCHYRQSLGVLLLHVLND